MEEKFHKPLPRNNNLDNTLNVPSHFNSVI